jgi:cytochrome c oxidase subunit 2
VSRPRPILRSRAARKGRARRLTGRLLALGALAVLATGCRVPIWGYPTHVADVQGHRIEDFWKYSMLAAAVVAVFVGALILWAPFAYRKRSDEIPKQVRYNLPVEILYTAVPFVIIASLFYYTARDENYLDKLTPHDQLVSEGGVLVDVTAFQWNWTFSYPDYTLSADGTTPVSSTGTQQEEAQLVLPAGKKVQFVEDSRDVIHSFWIPAFVFKRDVIPGRQNKFEITPDRPGTYVGRCAELCGVYHDRMNFQVTILPYDQWLTWVKQQQKTGVSGVSSTTGSSPVGSTTGSSS